MLATSWGGSAAIKAAIIPIILHYAASDALA
jgi:hypothetical protein